MYADHINISHLVKGKEIMFQGFNEATLKYWERIKLDNSKEAFKSMQELYTEGIKYPLEELYYDLMSYFEEIEPDMNFRKSSCISSPYNDARFCGNTPMKEYVYVRFKLAKSRKENVAGFYFDASADDFRYGINIYNLNARGMEQIRGEMLRDEEAAGQIIKRVNKNKVLEVSGDMYKRSYYPDKDELIRSWLDRKSIHFSHEEPISEVFFQRTLLENMLEAFDKSLDLYNMLKRALR